MYEPTVIKLVTNPQAVLQSNKIPSKALPKKTSIEVKLNEVNSGEK